QRLQHRVPPGHPLRAAATPAGHRRTLGPGGLAARLGLLGLVRLVVDPILRLRGRPLALQAAADPAAGAGGPALALAADRTLALAVARHHSSFVGATLRSVHRVPSGVSVSSMPCSVSEDRIASAAA